MLSDELRQLRDTAREVARRELEPRAEHWDRSRELPPEALRALADLGFLGLLVPEEDGGSGFDAVGFCLAIEEISRAVPALGLLLSIHNGPVCRLVGKAGPSERARWLPRLAAGDVLGAFALSEEEAGSDVGGIRAAYEPAGGGFVLRGEKAWVSGAGLAGLAVAFARRDTDPVPGAGAEASGLQTADGDGARSARRARISAFLVDLKLPEVRLGEVEETMGLRAAPVRTVVLDGVRVGGDALVRREGDGFALAQEALALGRLGIAAQSLGIAGRAIESAVAYTRDRRQFGRPVSEFQGVRLPLAELAARLEAARALVYRTAHDAEARDFPARAAMAKLVASDLAVAASLQAVQAYGGYGYVKDYPVERFFRDAKACQIYEGTNEIQKIVIAKELFHD